MASVIYLALSYLALSPSLVSLWLQTWLNPHSPVLVQEESAPRRPPTPSVLMIVHIILSDASAAYFRIPSSIDLVLDDTQILK